MRNFSDEGGVGIAFQQLPQSERQKEGLKERVRYKREKESGEREKERERGERQREESIVLKSLKYSLHYSSHFTVSQPAFYSFCSLILVPHPLSSATT